mgnify:CR=1 FL=1
MAAELARGLREGDRGAHLICLHPDPSPASSSIFHRERWYQKILHNETAYLIQKRLQWAGLTMVILPAKVR